MPRKRSKFRLVNILSLLMMAVLSLSAQAQTLYADSDVSIVIPSSITKPQNLRPASDIVVQRAQPTSNAELTTQALLLSEAAFVQDLGNQDVLYNKNSDEVRPIASISKLMKMQLFQMISPIISM